MNDPSPPSGSSRSRPTQGGLVAAELPLVALIGFGLLLCGTYVHDKEGGGFRKRKHGPLTAVDALRRRVGRARGERGANKAARALRFVADGSASPMETLLCMALCLSRMLGGFGLELPRLNHRIEAGSAHGLLGRDCFVCDLYWPRCKIAGRNGLGIDFKRQSPPGQTPACFSLSAANELR